MAAKRPARVMVIASGGGHWTQMLRLAPAWAGLDVFYVGVKQMYEVDVPGSRFYAVEDVSRLHRLALFRTVCQLAWILLKERPRAIVTTGSAPGMLALRLGKALLGCRTLWLDSVANVEEMSLSGRKAAAHADLLLTQWPHLAKAEGPHYKGALL